MRSVSARRLAVAAAAAAVGVGLVGFAIFLYWQGLDRADQWSSVVAGFAGLAGLGGSVASLMAGGRPNPPGRPPLVPVRTAWGTQRVPAATMAVLQAQSRSTQSVPYRVTGIDTVPLATMYVRQQLEVHRTTGPVEPTLPTIERMGVRMRPVSGTKVLPVMQKVEHVLGKHRHLVIEGGPGLGKSSLGRHLTAELAHAWLDADGAPPPSVKPLLPLLISARALSRQRGRPWLDALARACAEELGQHADAETTADALAHVPASIPWTVFVDGLDEVADDERHQLIDVLAERMVAPDSRWRIVVMSRPLADAGWRRLNATETGVYSLLPFTSDALRDFAETALKVLRPEDPDALATRFLDQLRRGGVAEVARVPLLSTIAMTIFALDPSRGLPRTQVDLYEQYIAHLADGGRTRRRQLRERLTEAAGASSEPTLNLLFERMQDLLEHVAVSQVETNDRLGEVALEWCRQEGLWLRSTAWPDAVQEALTTTGLLVRRGGDIRFIHHTFAEHVAAGRRASQLPAHFDPQEPGWIDWIRRAINEDGVGMAVLVRWARQNPASPLLDWLQQGSVNHQWLALELIASGAPATPAQILASLSYVERRSAQLTGPNEWLLAPLVRFGSDATVRGWAMRILRDRDDDPPLQAAAARLMAESHPHEREAARISASANPARALAAACVMRRLTDDLLPGHRLALANAAEVLVVGTNPVIPEQYWKVLHDRRATPAHRLAAGQALAGLGRDHRDATIAGLSRLQEDTDLLPAHRAVAARVLADLLPERRRQLAQFVRVSFDRTWSSDADRFLIAQALAEIDADETAEGSTLLRALAADPGLDLDRRREAAAVLADLGTRHRDEAAGILLEMAADPGSQRWERSPSIQRLSRLGPDHHAALEQAATTFFDDLSTMYLPDAAYHWFLVARAAAGLPDDRRRHLVNRLTVIADDPGHPLGIAAAVARGALAADFFPEAVSLLRSKLDQPPIHDKSASADLLAEIDPSSVAAARSGLSTAVARSFARWSQVLAGLRVAWAGADGEQEAAALFLRILQSGRNRSPVQIQAAAWLADVERTQRGIAVRSLIQCLTDERQEWALSLAVRVLTSCDAATYQQCVERLSAISRGGYPAARRIVAAAVLASLGYPQLDSSGTVLHGLLADPHTSAADQLAAAREIVKAGGPRKAATAALKRLLSDQHTDVPTRVGADLLLGRLGSASPAGTWLNGALEDSTLPLEVRTDLAEQLMCTRHTEAAQVTENIVADREAVDWHLRRAADIAFRIGPAAATATERILRDRMQAPETNDSARSRLTAALAMLGPARFREAGELLARSLAAKRHRAAVILDICDELNELGPAAQLTAVQAIDELVLRHPLTPAERVLAVKVRATSAGIGPTTAESARAVLDDPRAEPDDIVAAAELSGRVSPGDGMARDILAGLGDRPDLPVPLRVNARLTEADVFPERKSDLGPQLTDTDPVQRLAAAWTLGRLHSDTDLPATILRNLAADSSIAVQMRWHAAVALDEHFAYRTDAADLMGAILDLDELTPADRCQVALRLAQFGDAGRDRAAAALIRALSRPDVPDRHRCDLAAALGQLSPVYRDRAAADLHAMTADQHRPLRVRLAATRRLSELSPAYHRSAVHQTLVALETAHSTVDRLRIAETLAEISTHVPTADDVLNAVATDHQLAPAIRLWAAQVAVQHHRRGWLELAEALRRASEDAATPTYLRVFAADTALRHAPPLRDWAVRWMAAACLDPATAASQRINAAAAIAPEPEHHAAATSALRAVTRDKAVPAEVRRQAAARLAAADPEATAEGVAVLAEISADETVRIATRVLAAVDSSLIGTANRTTAIDFLQRQLSVPRRRLLATWALAQVGGPPAADAITILQTLEPDAATRLDHLAPHWEIPLAD